MNNNYLLAVGMFALGLDAYVIAGLIPALSQSFHVGAAEVGQAVTIFTCCYALSAPVCSALLVGRSMRQVLLWAMMIFIIGNVVSALAQNLMELFVGRAIAGIGAGLYSPMAASAAASLVSVKKKGRAIGFILGGMSAGAVIGVPLGLLVANDYSWQSTFWFVTVLGGIALSGIYLYFPFVAAKAPSTLRERVRMLTNPRVACTILVSFSTSISSLGLYTYLAPIVESTLGVGVIIPYLWAWGVGGIIGSLTVGHLIDYTGRPKQLLLGILIIMTLSIMFLPIMLPYKLLGFLPLILWGAMGWASQAPQQHILLSIQPEHGAVLVALNSSANYLGSAVGAAIGGVCIGWGVLPAQLPVILGIVAIFACIVQLCIINAMSS